MADKVKDEVIVEPPGQEVAKTAIHEGDVVKGEEEILSLVEQRRDDEPEGPEDADPTWKDMFNEYWVTWHRHEVSELFTLVRQLEEAKAFVDQNKGTEYMAELTEEMKEGIAQAMELIREKMKLGELTQSQGEIRSLLEKRWTEGDFAKPLRMMLTAGQSDKREAFDKAADEMASAMAESAIDALGKFQNDRREETNNGVRGIVENATELMENGQRQAIQIISNMEDLTMETIKFADKRDDRYNLISQERESQEHFEHESTLERINEERRIDQERFEAQIGDRNQELAETQAALNEQRKSLAAVERENQRLEEELAVTKAALTRKGGHENSEELARYSKQRSAVIQYHSECAKIEARMERDKLDIEQSERKIRRINAETLELLDRNQDRMDTMSAKESVIFDRKRSALTARSKIVKDQLEDLRRSADHKRELRRKAELASKLSKELDVSRASKEITADSFDKLRSTTLPGLVFQRGIIQEWKSFGPEKFLQAVIAYAAEHLLQFLAILPELILMNTFDNDTLSPYNSAALPVNGAISGEFQKCNSRLYMILIDGLKGDGTKDKPGVLNGEELINLATGRGARWGVSNEEVAVVKDDDGLSLAFAIACTFSHGGLEYRQSVKEVLQNYWARILTFQQAKDLMRYIVDVTRVCSIGEQLGIEVGYSEGISRVIHAVSGNPAFQAIHVYADFSAVKGPRTQYFNIMERTETDSATGQPISMLKKFLQALMEIAGNSFTQDYYANPERSMAGPAETAKSQMAKMKMSRAMVALRIEEGTETETRGATTNKSALNAANTAGTNGDTRKVQTPNRNTKWVNGYPKKATDLYKRMYLPYYPEGAQEEREQQDTRPREKSRTSRSCLASKCSEPAIGSAKFCVDHAEHLYNGGQLVNTFGQKITRMRKSALATFRALKKEGLDQFQDFKGADGFDKLQSGTTTMTKNTPPQHTADEEADEETSSANMASVFAAGYQSAKWGDRCGPRKP